MILGIAEQLLIFLLIVYILLSYLPIYLVITFILSGIIAYVYYLNYEHTFWERRGIPSTKPHWFFGHSKMLAEGMHLYDQEMSKKHETYGSYIFGKRDIASTNLDLLRKILVKDFDHFIDKSMRISISMINPKNPKDDKHSLYINALPSKTGDDWKRVRNLVTPAFTTGKLKQLIPTFAKCAKELCIYLEKYVSEKKDIPLKEVMDKLTLTVIGRSDFGIEVDAFSEEETPFLINANKIFGSSFDEFRAYFMMLFPNICEFIRRHTGHQILKNDSHSFFKNMLEKLLQERRSDPDAPRKYNDFFQLLLNSLDVNDTHPSENTENVDYDIIHDEISDSTQKKKTISKIEILAQSFVVMLAGYETSATTLHFMVYILAQLPGIQDRVRDEIMELIEDRAEIEYEDLTKLKYLHQVMWETLRMYPPTTRTNRACTKDITIDGIMFEEGMSFSVPSYIIHYDEKYYPNPKEFDPERFSPENKSKRDPLAFLAFGYGPRNCIGMRFAELEIKTAMAIILKNYRFVAIPGSPDLPLEITSKGMTRAAQPLYVRAEKL